MKCARIPQTVILTIKVEGALAVLREDALKSRLGESPDWGHMALWRTDGLSAQFPHFSSSISPLPLPSRTSKRQFRDWGLNRPAFEQFHLKVGQWIETFNSPGATPGYARGKTKLCRAGEYCCSKRQWPGDAELRTYLGLGNETYHGSVRCSSNNAVQKVIIRAVLLVCGSKIWFTPHRSSPDHWDQ